jgi:hypothetical protein
MEHLDRHTFHHRDPAFDARPRHPVGAGASRSLAQDDHSHMDAMKRDQSSNVSAFLKIVPCPTR